MLKVEMSKLKKSRKYNQRPLVDYLKVSFFEQFIKDNKEIPEIFTIKETGMIETLQLCNSQYKKNK